MLSLAENTFFKVGVRADLSKSLVVEAFVCDAENIDKIPVLRGFKSMYPYLESDAKRIEFHLHSGQVRSLTQLIAIHLATDLQTPFWRMLSTHRAAVFLGSITVGFPAIQHLCSGLFALVLAVIFSINKHILQVDWLPFFQFLHLRHVHEVAVA